jgi:PmbA protein
MITDDNKKLAQWAMEYALKNGCQAAKLVLYTNSNSSFELRDGKWTVCSSLRRMVWD